MSKKWQSLSMFISLEVSVEVTELEEINKRDFSGIEKWNMGNVKEIRYMFYSSPMQENPPKWYKGATCKKC
ncbi:TPA: hypothetical protein RZH69_001163 [Campylobacter coli]|uniref:hypothetical protein n=1 Tax=Campylobacter coli TaxID=195 RepID=UPI00092EB556|nr:hypothetical protein [Campylobacter coli]HEB7543298.1 hypothetical protein [Campylobacter coli]HEB7554193.1 hypothetical protein [Campylobacter coli]